MHERIVKSIIEFEKSLKEDEEVGGRIVNCPGPENSFHISDVGYWGPDLLIYYGQSLDKRPMELLQHYTQVSILLIALPVVDRAPTRIGFELSKRLDDENDAE